MPKRHKRARLFSMDRTALLVVVGIRRREQVDSAVDVCRVRIQSALVPVTQDSRQQKCTQILLFMKKKRSGKERWERLQDGLVYSWHGVR